MGKREGGRVCVYEMVTKSQSSNHLYRDPMYEFIYSPFFLGMISRWKLEHCGDFGVTSDIGELQNLPL